MTRTASERGVSLGDSRYGQCLLRTGSQAWGSLWAGGPTRGRYPGLWGAWSPTHPTPGHSPACYSPVPISPSRFQLQTGPRGAGPRCWPSRFGPEPQSLWYVFSNGTELTVLGKWLSPHFSSCPMPLLSRESHPSLSGSCFPSSLPALRTNPYFSP